MKLNPPILKAYGCSFTYLGSDANELRNNTLGVTLRFIHSNKKSHFYAVHIEDVVSHYLQENNRMYLDAIVSLFSGFYFATTSRRYMSKENFRLYVIIALFLLFKSPTEIATLIETYSFIDCDDMAVTPSTVRAGVGERVTIVDDGKNITLNGQFRLRMIEFKEDVTFQGFQSLRNSLVIERD